MKRCHEEHDKIINEIIDNEWDMFDHVRASEPSACQEHPKAFRLMRWMSHSVLPTKVLQSYLNDLLKAVQEGRNLITEKYARMENKIPYGLLNPKIQTIVCIESEWKELLSDKYPLTIQHGSGDFQKYMACELSTYSDETIELYYEAVMEAKETNRNLVEERYANLFKKLGYQSISAREERSRREHEKIISQNTRIIGAE